MKHNTAKIVGGGGQYLLLDIVPLERRCASRLVSKHLKGDIQWLS